MKDLTGQRFGLLVVTSFDRKQASPSGQLKYYWNVHCDCGNQKSVQAANLRRGNTSSCGCQERGAGRSSAYKGKPTWLSKLWTQYKGGAARRALQFDLNIEQVEQLAKADCIYCGKAPAERLWAGKQVPGGMFVNGIDRKNNSLGYTTDNSVPCCTVCNRMKMAMNYEEFIEHVSRIAAHVK